MIERYLIMAEQGRELTYRRLGPLACSDDTKVR